MPLIIDAATGSWNQLDKHHRALLAGAGRGRDGGPLPAGRLQGRSRAPGGSGPTVPSRLSAQAQSPVEPIMGRGGGCAVLHLLEAHSRLQESCFEPAHVAIRGRLALSAQQIDCSGRRTDTVSEGRRTMSSPVQHPVTVEQHWVRLRPKDPSEVATSPKETESLTRELVDRVQARAGKPAQSVKVLGNLGAFLVTAEPEFIQELRTQPEVASVARASEPNLGLIRPVESKPVVLKPRRVRAKTRVR